MKIFPGSKFSQLHRKLSYTKATTQHTGSEHRFSTLHQRPSDLGRILPRLHLGFLTPVSAPHGAVGRSQ